MNARECAGLIHSDIQKNFIQLKVYNYRDWLQFTGKKELEEARKIHKKGVDYIVEEGDICYFVFSRN
jgi:ribosome-binding ATPase YchF (GTP1/OBG family)